MPSIFPTSYFEDIEFRADSRVPGSIMNERRANAIITDITIPNFTRIFSSNAILSLKF